MQVVLIWGFREVICSQILAILAKVLTTIEDHETSIPDEVPSERVPVRDTQRDTCIHTHVYTHIHKQAHVYTCI